MHTIAFSRNSKQRANAPIVHVGDASEALATRNYVTLGEMCNALIEHFGVYEEQAVF